MALIEVLAYRHHCGPCREVDAGIDPAPICQCGERMRRFSHAIRWICLACKNSVPMKPCSCRDALFVGVGNPWQRNALQVLSY